ncbi:unnamed protein product [Nesidiocoris tenuis]|uniref:Uncharacterized protein n=1 Tax=Nesidiocoris tenuis TaxID=355587 RepID=A0A6H5G4R5_9HEMI|nr:unnamed protein product [Nesidiocoris tenuis]
MASQIASASEKNTNCQQPNLMPNINICGSDSRIRVSLTSDPTLTTREVPQIIRTPSKDTKLAILGEVNEHLDENNANCHPLDPELPHIPEISTKDSNPLKKTTNEETGQSIDFAVKSAVSDGPELWHAKQDQEAWSTPRSRSAESLCATKYNSKLRICNIFCQSASRMHLSISERSFPEINQALPLKSSPQSSTVGFSALLQDDHARPVDESASSDHQKFLSFANFDPSFKLSEEVLEGSGDFVANPSKVEQKKIQDRLDSLSSFESTNNTLLSSIYRRLAKSLQSAKFIGKTTKINSILDVTDGRSEAKTESIVSDSVPLSKAVHSLEKERITSLRTNLKNRDLNKETALCSDHSAVPMDAFGDSYQNSDRRPKSRRHRFDHRSSWTSDRLKIHNEFVLRSHLYLSLMLQKRTLADRISTLSRSVEASHQFPSSNTLGVIHKSVQTSGYNEFEVSENPIQNVYSAKRLKPRRTKVAISKHSVYDRRRNEVRCRVINKRLRYSSYNMLKRAKMIEGAIRNSVSQIVKNTKIDQSYGFRENPDCQAVSISHRFQSGGQKNQIVLKYEAKKYTVYNETKKKTPWSILGKKATYMLSLVYPINVDPQQIVELRKRGMRSRTSIVRCLMPNAKCLLPNTSMSEDTLRYGTILHLFRYSGIRYFDVIQCFVLDVEGPPEREVQQSIAGETNWCLVIRTESEIKTSTKGSDLFVLFQGWQTPIIRMRIYIPAKLSSERQGKDLLVQKGVDYFPIAEEKVQGA